MLAVGFKTFHSSLDHKEIGDFGGCNIILSLVSPCREIPESIPSMKRDQI